MTRSRRRWVVAIFVALLLVPLAYGGTWLEAASLREDAVERPEYESFTDAYAVAPGAILVHEYVRKLGVFREWWSVWGWYVVGATPIWNGDEVRGRVRGYRGPRGDIVCPMAAKRTGAR